MLLRSARTLIGAITIAVFWAFGAGWLAQPVLDLAQPSAPPGGQTVAPATYASHTAIVMLGTGTIHRDGKLVPPKDAIARIVKSADLYTRCKHVSAVCHVIVSGGNPQDHEATEADTYLPYLLREGVPRGDIILENSSLTTYQNARNVAAILPAGYYGSLMLVTSAYQMPRALLDFHRFGMDPLPIVSNTREAKRGLLPRPQNFSDAEIALHELIGIAQFHVYRQIGWF
ncbi:YdcF family protein [Burkholderia sp. Ac-20365]|uniref:YdcF family protein n=1 Tax=Burkholderia sp. Ac-20365 TaxID=2703897 RepID=UPI00197BF2C3|nr:YdcF family protein [Burkholderia sp. Ac-20365]MBN3767505.1 YdcF family protein [Burkholderia sp. Ac-20365]